jgi:2'-5' RNA ligase
MHCWPGPADRINSFALVSYIPGPLGRFLDDLRRELLPESLAQAHVSVLPPRQLASEQDAEVQLATVLPKIAPFYVEMTGIEVFESTSVIYVGIGAGCTELRRLHDTLNDHALQFQECFEYQPHVTLAQSFPCDQLPALAETAQRCWEEYTSSREFLLDSLIFVQNTARNSWVDIAQFSLQRQ